MSPRLLHAHPPLISIMGDIWKSLFGGLYNGEHHWSSMVRKVSLISFSDSKAVLYYRMTNLDASPRV